MKDSLHSVAISIAAVAAGTILLLGSSSAFAHNRVEWSVNIGTPLYYSPPVVYSQPVPVYSSEPVFVPDPPVVVYGEPYRDSHRYWQEREWRRRQWREREWREREWREREWRERHRYSGW